MLHAYSHNDLISTEKTKVFSPHSSINFSDKLSFLYAKLINSKIKLAYRILFLSIEIQVIFAKDIIKRPLHTQLLFLPFIIITSVCIYLTCSSFSQCPENSYFFIKNICAKFYLVLSVFMLSSTPQPSPTSWDFWKTSNI